MASFSLVSLVHSEAGHNLPLPRFPAYTEPCNLESLLRDGNDGDIGTTVWQNDAGLPVEAARIASLLEKVDVSYLSIRDDVKSAVAPSPTTPGTFRSMIEQHSPGIFTSAQAGRGKRKSHKSPIATPSTTEGVPGALPQGPDLSQAQAPVDRANYAGELPNPPLKRRRTSIERKGRPAKKDEVSTCERSTDPGATFVDLLDEYFERTDKVDGARVDGFRSFLLSVRELTILSGEILKQADANQLQAVEPSMLLRLMNLLDHDIQMGNELELDEEHEESNTNASILVALEAIQAAMNIMIAPEMPKQVYSEEVIERIIQVTRYHIVHNIFPAFDITHRSQQREEAYDEDGGDAVEMVEGSTSGRKAKRKNKGKKATAAKTSRAATVVLDKVCSILAAMGELLVATRLQDSVLLQLTKTALAAFNVENIELLQLKCLNVMGTVFKHYPQHRLLIMDDVISMFWKLPSSGKSLRLYHLVEDQKQIQMMSALLIRLIQSSADISSFLVHADGKVDEASESTTEEAARVEGGAAVRCFDPTKEFATYFWKNVLQSWGTPKKHEYVVMKDIVENLVNDLLECLNIPEMPAANLLLQILCILLMKSDGLHSKDYVVKAATVDLLGIVACRLKKDACISEKERLWLLKGQDSGDVDSSGKPELPQRKKGACVVCEQQKGNGFSVTCGTCQRFFHGACVPVGEADVAQGRKWLCHLCICEQQLVQLDDKLAPQAAAKSKKGRRNSMPSTGSGDTKRGHAWKSDEQAVLQQIMLNYLQGRELQGDVTAAYALSFYLCWWYREQVDVDGSFDFFRCRIQALKDSEFTAFPSRRKELCRVSMELGLQRPLAKGFDNILEVILMILQDQASSPRAKALKAVGGLVEVDPAMLEDDRVKQAVEGRFLDSSISVREAAVDLVGKYMMISPTVALKYYDRIAERIRDTGVSVRKKVIKIIKDVVLSINNFPRKTDACMKLMERITDDETGIQDLVVKTFHEIWFEQDLHSRNGVPDANSLPPEVVERTEQIVEVLSGTSVQLSRVVDIIKRSLEQDANPQTARNGTMNLTPQGAVRRRCEMICRCMLEGILKVYETSSVESEARALPYITGLQVFCMADPSLLTPSNDPSRFAVTLKPYLKTQPDQKEASTFVQGIIFIIDALLPLLRRPSETFLDELDKDLRSKIISHPYYSVVQSCVKCLCMLEKIHSKTSQTIAILVNHFYSRLNKRKQLDEETTKNAVIRSLFVLGNLARYAEGAIEAGAFGEVTMKGILSVYIFYLKNKDFKVKWRALQGLGFIFVTKPELMLGVEMQGMLDATLLPKSDPRLKKQTLLNLSDYLHDVEVKLASGGNQPNVVRGPSGDVPVAAGAGDMNNNCGGILQVYWEKILDRALDSDVEVRQAALKVIEVVLKQGLVHPVTSVPTLVALEVDQHDANAKAAHRLVMMLFEKYPQFLEDKLGDGLQKSFHFVSSGAAASTGLPASPQNGIKSKGKGTLSALSEASQEGISRVYKLIRHNRQSRNRFIGSIVKKFDNSNILRNSSDLVFLEYCSDILATLPFVAPDEPLYVVYSINRLIQLQGGPLQAMIKATISGSGPLAENAKRVADEMEAENAEKGEEAYDLFVTDESQVEVQVVSREDDTQGAPEVALEKVKDDCKQAMAFAMLLLLKRHLKYAYNLSDARCQAFQPSEAQNKSEILSRRDLGAFSCKDLPLEPPDTMRQILNQYHKFKTLLRDDSTSDFTGFSTTTKRKGGNAGKRAVNRGDGSLLAGLNGTNLTPPTRSKRRKSEPGPSWLAENDNDHDDEGQVEENSDEDDGGESGRLDRKKRARQKPARSRKSMGGQGSGGRRSIS